MPFYLTAGGRAGESESGALAYFEELGKKNLKSRESELEEKI